MRTRCPACGATSSLDVLVSHEDARAALTVAFKVAGPVGVALLRYLALHRPATRELTMARVASLMTDLLPCLEAGSVPRKGRQWQVLPQDWVQAIEQMQTAFAQGKLTVPLNGHGYLFEVLCSFADKREAAQESAAEQQRRTGRPFDGNPELAVQVRGHALSVVEVLDGLGPEDPALARIKADSARGVPMPEEVRKRMAELRASFSSSSRAKP